MRVAVTGNMGAGKSTFARLLAEVGGARAVLVDADAVSRELVDGSAALRQELADAFGADLIDEATRLDRRDLARRALADEAGRQRLEDVVRPHLQPRLEAALAAAEGDGVTVILDAPLIFEWGIEGWFDRVIVVAADADTAAARVAASRGITSEEVRQRRAAQRQAPPVGLDVVRVDNSGDLADLRRSARSVWHALMETD